MQLRRCERMRRPNAFLQSRQHLASLIPLLQPRSRQNALQGQEGMLRCVSAEMRLSDSFLESTLHKAWLKTCAAETSHSSEDSQVDWRQHHLLMAVSLQSTAVQAAPAFPQFKRRSGLFTKLIQSASSCELCGAAGAARQVFNLKRVSAHAGHV